MPEGWTVDGYKDIYLEHSNRLNHFMGIGEYTVTAGETVEARNKVIIEAICEGRPSIGLAELVLLG